MSEKEDRRKIYFKADILDSTMLALEKMITDATDHFNDPLGEKFGLAFIHSLEIELRFQIASLMYAGYDLETANKMTTILFTNCFDEIMEGGLEIFHDYNNKLNRFTRSCFTKHHEKE